MKFVIAGFLLIGLAVTAQAGSRRFVRQIDNDNNQEFGNGEQFFWPPRRTTTTTTTTQPPSQQTPNPQIYQRCMQTCGRTPEYNPYCGTLLDGTAQTFNNPGEMNCAIFCGRRVASSRLGTCTALT